VTSYYYASALLVDLLRTPLVRRLVDSRVSLDSVLKRKFPAPASTRTPDHPARSPEKYHWVPGTLSLGIKWPGMKLTTHLHLAQRSRMRGAIPSLYNTPSWRGAHFKHRDNFTFTLYVYVCMYVCMYTCMHMYIRMHVCTCVCMCACLCVCFLYA